MKKKIVSLLLAGCLLMFALAGCSGESAGTGDKGTENGDTKNESIENAATVPEETEPEETVPEETRPEETAPQETKPQESGPEETVPEETGPEETGPEETIPQETEPQETAPEETVPQEAGPEETVPKETEPQETVPQETAPQETAPQETAPQETGPVSTEEQETVSVIDKVRAFADENPLAFGGICAAVGVVLALVIALAAALIVRGRRKKRGDGGNGSTVRKPAVRIRVEKLHEQGARKNQQDCFAVSPTEFADKQGLLAIVADGMGGLEHGERVSQAAVSAALNGFFTASGSHEQVLLDLLGRAVSDVDALLGPGGLTRSGSTMVMGLLRDGLFDFVSVGDSRICLYRDGALYQLNREHTFKYELAARAVSGAVELRQVYEHPKAGGLTSYLGMGDIKYVDMPSHPLPVRTGDKFVLMTDGVYNAVTDQELIRVLSGASVPEELRTLISSKGYTNQDNFTAVILSVGEAEGPARVKAKRR